ncbi:MAG: 50S ribosomal protein L32 [Candidatus Sericytochromatia bacterium]|nr:50S ribosomal protein L32 [Candidatus Sericytochromatia bacterium]
MPQPKKKTSHSKQGHTRHHWKAILPSLVKCNHCSEMKHSHKVCEFCGYYNGLLILQTANSK